MHGRDLEVGVNPKHLVRALMGRFLTGVVGKTKATLDMVFLRPVLIASVAPTVSHLPSGRFFYLGRRD